MRNPRIDRRRPVCGAAALAGALLLAGCTSQAGHGSPVTGAPAPPPAAPPGPTSQTASPTPSEAVASGAVSSGTVSTGAVSTGAESSGEMPSGAAHPGTVAPAPDPSAFDVPLQDFNHGLTDGAALFTSPSGAFVCAIRSADAHAPARAACSGDTAPLPPRPQWCSGDAGWGTGMVVEGGGGAHFRCAGDVAGDPSAPALPYGQGITALGFTCASHRSGMYCRDNNDGHGFMIAREDNALF